MMFLIEEHYFRENHQEVSNLKDWNSSLYQFTRNTSPFSKNHIKSGHFHGPTLNFHGISPWGDPAKCLQDLPTWWNAPVAPVFWFFWNIHHSTSWTPWNSNFIDFMSSLIHHWFHLKQKTQQSLCRKKIPPVVFPGLHRLFQSQLRPGRMGTSHRSRWIPPKPHAGGGEARDGGMWNGPQMMDVF